MSTSFFTEQSEASEVKATIVSKYFGAWAKIMMGRRNVENINYIDLFAGPGRFQDGKMSTPLMVLEQAINHDKLRDRLVAIFNDKDTGATDLLRQEIQLLPGVGSLKHPPQIVNEEVGEQIAALFESKHLSPTLFFVDPWGYKGLSLRLVNSVLKDWGCDCVFFFNYNRINMGLANPVVTEHLNALFGEERADALRARIRGMTPENREYAIVSELAQAMKDLGGKCVLPFRFVDDAGNRTSHYLVFISKHPLGYGIMKEIMAKESSSTDDGVASFEYTPRPPAYTQTSLLDGYTRPLDGLGDDLLAAFGGTTMTVKEIFENHNVDTPFIKPNYKEALKRLEANGAISADPPATARRGTSMADHVTITFPEGA
jgi:three-Cys-motif partner protein